MTYFLTCLLTALSSSFAEAFLDAQPALAPGTEGLWPVHGARLTQVRPGDVILIKAEDEVEVRLIQGTFLAKAAPMRAGFIADGAQFTYGALAPFTLLRWGTHRTLA